MNVIEVLEKGGLIGYPTNTLYALGCDIFNEFALRKVFEVKKRPLAEPLPIGVADIYMAKSLARISRQGEKLYEKFGEKITMLVVSKVEMLSGLIKDKKIGIRIINHPASRKIIQEFGPLTCTSANLHGGKPPTSMEVAKEQLGEHIAVWAPGKCKYRKASTVVDLIDDKIKVVREGLVSYEALKKV